MFSTICRFIDLDHGKVTEPLESISSA